MKFDETTGRPVYNGKLTHPGYHELRSRKNELAQMISTLRTIHMQAYPTPMKQSILARMSDEYRAMHLAHRYLRGRSYRGAEPVSNTLPNWELIRRLVRKYGAPIAGTMPPLNEWARANS